MILETLVTTLNEDGLVNISPMGPTVSDDSLQSFELRPFDSSRTLSNLKRTRMGVLHITDDVEMFAQAAIGVVSHPRLHDAERVEGKIISDSCRCYEFEVEFIDESGPRASLNCRTVVSDRFRDFLGFNRAKHAVIEAAILATRLDFLPADEVSESFIRLATIIDKTGGPKETRAFALLSDFAGLREGN